MITLIFLFVAPALDEEILNLIYIIVLVTMSLLLAMVKETYKRRAHEDASIVKPLLGVA
jgi:hypothetical protein